MTNPETSQNVETLKDDIQRHVALTLGSDPFPPRKERYYLGLCYSVRDRLLGKWLETSVPTTTPLPSASITCRWNFCPDAFS